MKKIITISVYGDDEKYCLGALRNIELAKELYPGWFVKIFYDKTVPEKYVTMYSNNDNVILEDMTSKKIPGMFWRFMCFDDKDIEVFIVRDADSRLLKREVEAVNDWLSKNKALHVMRDHPHHNYKILGGMWGFRNDIATYKTFNKEVNDWVQKKPTFQKMDDMIFLARVYDKFIHSNVIHDSYSRYNDSVSFPTNRDGKNFVGEIYYFENDEEKLTDHWKYL